MDIFFYKLMNSFLTNSLWVVCDVYDEVYEVYEIVYEAHRQIRSKKTTSQHLDMSWCCEVISITNGFVYEVYEPHRQIRASGGVTGGFGWVQTHPLSKKAPMRFFRNPKNFRGVGGGLREKKHELCQIVLNKQQHLHDADYSLQLWSLIYCSDHCRLI